LQPGIGPLVTVRVSDVQLRNGNCVDLIARLGNDPLHRLLIIFSEDARHTGRGWSSSEAEREGVTAGGHGRTEVEEEMREIRSARSTRLS